MSIREYRNSHGDVIGAVYTPPNAKVHIQSVEAIVREWLMKYDRMLVGSEAEKRLVAELEKLR
jgi:hypothetical protein